MTRGVARIACVQCAFSFVMRLGDPNAAKKKEEERDPLQPATLEGVTHSGATAATAGEIGLGHRSAFIPSQTRSSIKLSPELMAMIEEDEARQRAAAMIEENERNAVAVVVAPGGGLDVDEGEASADQAAASSQQAAPPAPMPVTAPMGVPAPMPATVPMPAAAPMPATVPMPAAAPMPPATPLPAPATSEPAPPELPDRPAADLMPRSPRPAPPPAHRDPEEPRPKVSRGGVEGPLRSSPTWTEDNPEMAAALAAPAAPPPLPPNDDSGGFEAFSPIGPAAAAPAPMASYPVQPTDPARMTGPMPAATPAPAYPQQAAPIPGYQDPSIDIYGLETPGEGRFVRFVGKLMLLTVFGALGFGLFVLYRNDWQLDFSNLDRMLDRALGNAPVTQATGAVTEGLEVSRPVVAKAQFIDGKKVITATGVVRNTGALSKRFIVVRAEIRRGVQVMVMAKAPAGNLFPPEEIATLDKESLYSLTNPAGKNGRNAKVAPQQSVEYMVVFTEFPEDFSLDRYQVVAKVDTAELYRGP